MPQSTDLLTPGETAARSGARISALHFYEREGLIESTRTAGNQRRYRREVLRRVAFIRVSQRVGISLKDIREALATLPDDRVPNKADWTRLSRRWRSDLDGRIEQLERLRDDLDGCIGCGCLSLKVCTLYNPDDLLRADGIRSPAASSARIGDPMTSAGGPITSGTSRTARTCGRPGWLAISRVALPRAAIERTRGSGSDATGAIGPRRPARNAVFRGRSQPSGVAPWRSTTTWTPGFTAARA